MQMRLIFNTIHYLIQIGYVVQILINQPIIKQHNHQSISELTFQIHNFDIHIQRIMFLMPIQNNVF